MKEYFQRKDTQISIGEMAELFEVSPRTLRLYHDMGLLIPQYINDSNGYRYYAQSQFPRLEKILQMKSLGLSLQQQTVLIIKPCLSGSAFVIQEFFTFSIKTSPHESEYSYREKAL